MISRGRTAGKRKRVGAGPPAGRDDALVDADNAVFEPLGDPPDATDVAVVEIGGQPKLGVVGYLDRVGVGLEAVERHRRMDQVANCPDPPADF